MASKLEFYSLYLTRFVDNLGYVAILTLLPAYINLLDPSGVAIGVFVSALGIGRTVAGVPLGWAADRYDKRALLLGSLVVSALAFVVYGLVETTTGLIVARTIQGLGSVGAGMVALALVGELAPETERANYIGKFNAWRLAAGIVGTLGVGAVFEYTGFTPIFAVLIALGLLAMAGIWWSIDADETTVEGIAYFDLAVNRRILTISSFRVQYAVAMTLVQTWIPIYVGVTVAKGGLGLASIAVGAVLAAEKVTNMLFQPYTGGLSDRYGRALFIFVGGGVYGLVALVIPFTPALGVLAPLTLTIPLFGTLPPVFFVALALNALLGVADSFREPASMALFADEGKGSGITSSFGIRGIVWRPGAILAPLVGGYVMSTYGIDWVFYIGGVAALSGILVFYGVLSVRHGPRALRQW
ncbi:MFS transporter [Haloarculaceae archaeon H-GB2-1]|nr:MFS transporter [Haloarculaceae archaeon H-GB1-1]MEA5387956.1 MFS transporter [Haloarculaceae archaeon H-GB11]MEA5409447.1 MFS transporter [Haloarculaceae archaeon H-GB2-1]